MFRIRRDRISGTVFLVTMCSIVFSFKVAHCNLNVGLDYIVCGNADDALSDYQTIIDPVTMDLVEHTATRSFKYYNERSYGEVTCHGQGQCYGLSVSGQGCVDCLEVANIMRKTRCKFVFGARVKLKSCFLWFEDYDFRSDG